MNPIQRLFTNTTLAFISNVVIKIGSSLLFILIGRQLGPSEAGIFNLGVTYFTVTLAFSAWGLHELLVREVSPRRDESGQYFLNYLVMRLLLTIVGYGVLIGLLKFALPYTTQTETVIKILSLAVFPEAVFALCHALFVAHERLLVPTIAATVNSSFKIGAGLWLLNNQYPVESIAWVMPIGSALSLLIFIPNLIRLLRQVPQRLAARLNLSFSLRQLRYTPGFILIGIFSTLDFQLDAFLISLLLTESDIGWYGASQTIVLGFWMMSSAIRTTLYPVMARVHKENPARLPGLYRLSNQYLLLVALPIAAGITILAAPITHFIYASSFDPAIPALQVMIWAVLFAFLSVPNARLMLVLNRQHPAGWMTGISMAVNVLLNLWLIPRLGIVGAAVARTTATAIMFFQLYGYAQVKLGMDSILPLLVRPLLAVAIMSAVVWPIRHLPLIWPIIAGIIVYGAAAYFLKAIPEEARQRLWQLQTISRR